MQKNINPEHLWDRWILNKQEKTPIIFIHFSPFFWKYYKATFNTCSIPKNISDICKNSWRVFLNPTSPLTSQMIGCLITDRSQNKFVAYKS